MTHPPNPYEFDPVKNPTTEFYKTAGECAAETALYLKEREQWNAEHHDSNRPTDNR